MYNLIVVSFFSEKIKLRITNYERSNKDSSNSEDETVAVQIFCPGISLWIVFNWPESGLSAFE